MRINMSAGAGRILEARVRFDGLTPWSAGQVRLARIPLLESKGPCYARYVGAQLYRGETFYLQLDSHMTMVPRWYATAYGEHSDELLAT